MLADELYRMIHVPRLKDENAAELFFGFGIGAVGRYHLAVLPIQGQGGLRPLKRFSTGPVPAGAKVVVIVQSMYRTWCFARLSVKPSNLLLS